jgi:hypothetical protein
MAGLTVGLLAVLGLHLVSAAGTSQWMSNENRVRRPLRPPPPSVFLSVLSSI